MIKKILLKLLKKLLVQHKFKRSALILKEGAGTLFEVDSNMYDINLKPITIVRAYPLGTQLLGIDEHEILNYSEYKSMPKEGMAMTGHDNDKFANYKED